MNTETINHGDIIREAKEAQINRCAGFPIINTRVKLAVSCPMIFADYPFDAQQCPIIFYIPNVRASANNRYVYFRIHNTHFA